MAADRTSRRLSIRLQQRTTAVPEVLLREISTADAQELATSFVAIEPWSRYPFKRESMLRYFAVEEPQAPRYKLTVNGRTAGAIGIRLNWLRGPYLQFLGLLPNFQQQGLGRLMVAWLEGTARAAGDTNMWVMTSDFNDGALRFYERYGFKRVATLDDIVKPGRDEVLLRKQLA